MGHLQCIFFSDSVLVKQCPSEEMVGGSVTLEFSMTDMECDHGFLTITINEAVRLK